MDILGWLWFGVTTVTGIIWTVLWFLLGGWVVTAAQLAVIVGIAFAYKYGWARAPVEIAQRARTIGRYLWAWSRARELPQPTERGQASTARTRTRRHPARREPGDVNLSTLLSLLAIGGLSVIMAL